jgi:ADP-dependent phosphofructokinase/glucokinase
LPSPASSTPEGDPPPPQSELNEFLNLLAEQAPSLFAEQQAQVVDDVRARCDSVALHQLTAQGIRLPWLIEQWNRRLRLSLRQDVPPERVICGFNALVDVGYQLDDPPGELGEFLRWVAAQANLSEHDACSQAAARATNGPLLTGKVDSALEMLAAILQAMRAPHAEWKPRLAPHLWEQVQEHIERRRVAGAKVSSRMGGASGNMAHVLSRLGVRTTGHWLYHSAEMAADSPANLMRLRLEGGQKVEETAKVDGIYSPVEGSPQADPARRSYVFDFKQGSTLCGVSAVGTGRVIFIAPLHLSATPISDTPKPWRRLILRTTTPTGTTQDGEVHGADAVLEDRGWPFLPAFASKRLERDALVVELASLDVMQKVAEQFDYFMLGGIQSIADNLHALQTLIGGHPSEPAVRTIIKHGVRGQLEVLARNGVGVHWEIGGIASPDLMDHLADICRGRVKSAGLNHEELGKIMGGMAFRQTRYALPRTMATHRSAILTRYDQAVHLARALGLDELYVHGTDVDLIVRRRTSRGALRQEIAVTLFAKGVVLLALLQRSVPNWTQYVQQAVIPPLLKAEGFVALLELAKGLAMRHFPNNEPLERRTFADIGQSGYYYERDPEDYSMMVIPVMWPALDIPFSTAGAGDITSSVVALYAGK